MIRTQTQTRRQAVPVLAHGPELQRLRALVDHNLGGRNAEAAERLASELDRATLVPASELPAGVVRMHARIAFEDEDTGTRREVQLVYPEEASATEGRISVLAPIGAALLGLSAGDSIDWTLPTGRTARLRILSVTAPPEQVAAAS